MDATTARLIFAACQEAGDRIASIVQPPPPELSEEEAADLTRRVSETLAYMFDLLIQPTIDEFPRLILMFDYFDRTAQ